MARSDLQITGGRVATDSITEGGQSRHRQRMVIDDIAGVDAFGVVTNSPAANTLLGRLYGLQTVLGAVTADPAANTVNARLKALLDGQDGLATEETLSNLLERLPLTIGRQAALLSLAAALSTEDKTALDAVVTGVQALVTVAGVGLTINVAPDTAAIANGSSLLTPKFAKISASSSGATPVVAGITSPNKKIRVVAYLLTANADVNAKFQSAGTDITGLLYAGAKGGGAPGYCPVGHFETAAGEALNINLSSGVAVGGHVTYVEVP